MNSIYLVFSSLKIQIKLINTLVLPATIFTWSWKYFRSKHIKHLAKLFHPKSAVGVNLIPSCSFSKHVFSKERLKHWFPVTFNIITSYVFNENFVEIPQLVQKIWGFFSFNIICFRQIFGIFWHFLIIFLFETKYVST